VPLRAILDTGVGARLLRLGQAAPDAVQAAAGQLRAELAAALAGLERE
jgi:V/A-type H+-transporting ATPase subunit A